MTLITGPPKLPWQEVAAKKRAIQVGLIDSYVKANSGKGCGLIFSNSQLTSKTEGGFDEATSIGNAADIAQRVASGQTTCTAVTKAYIRKIIETHNETNCLTEIAFEDAVKQATELDAKIAKGEKLTLPLLGVPVTIKDQFNIKGYDTTLGYVGRSFQPVEDDAVVVKMLKSLGAIIIAKTNIPQSIMWCETENPLWGLTTNPVSKAYTPGGSTGGEGALLASNASVMGWGTDIGGSIRIPSHMNGLYGLKPSSARLPYRGVPVSTEGQQHVPSSIGPLARTLDTIRLTMASLMDAKPWEKDAGVAEIPWKQEVYNEALSRPLTIGILLNDGVVRPHPPLTRVMQSAIEALEKAGHDVFEWNADLHPDCIKVMDQYYTSDGCEDIRRDVMAGGEPYITRVQQLVDGGEAISVYQYWQLNRQKIELQQAYLEKWQSTLSPKTGRMADIILMPPMPHAAVPHGNSRWVGYTKVWNFVDYPALVIPGGSICRDDVNAPWDYEAQGPMDEWNKELWTKHKEEMASLSLPVGLQIIGRKLEEEKVLAAGKVIDDLIRGVSAPV